MPSANNDLKHDRILSRVPPLHINVQIR